ncbi:hypothetical protein MCO_01125 [Bartonella sp. DB5-6]|nr:hypothetical protein MCO_01125 [Bartonella sp. DB5-6]
MLLMNRLNARAVATLGAGKYNDGAGLLLHKCKDGGLNGFTVIPFMSAAVK